MKCPVLLTLTLLASGILGVCQDEALAIGRRSRACGGCAIDCGDCGTCCSGRVGLFAKLKARRSCGSCGVGCGSTGCGGCSSCGCDGCGFSGCDGCSGCGGGYETEIMIEGSSEGQPTEATGETIEGQQTGRNHRSVFSTVGYQQDVASAADALNWFRAGSYDEARDAFTRVSASEPTDAMHLYWLALSQWRAGDEVTAGQTLNSAVAVEREHPVANWGKRMERIQGRQRLWIEKARRQAGVTH